MKKNVFYIFVIFFIVVGLSIDVKGEETNISEELSIVGIQISTNVNLNGENVGVGVRTIYCLNLEIQGKNVEEFGLIYGLGVDENKYSEMKLYSDNPYIYACGANGDGVITKPNNAVDAEIYYAMIMPVYSGLTQEYYVRPYAILSDSTVVYGHIESYSAYRIADYLYQNSLETSETRHKALYQKVLKRVDASYEEIEYEYCGTVMPAEEPAYYSDLEKALKAAEKLQTVDADAKRKDAKASLRIEGKEAIVTLHGHAELTEDIQIPECLVLDLNDYSVSSKNGGSIYYENNLTIENGTLDFENVQRVLSGSLDEDRFLNINQVEIIHKNNSEDGDAFTVMAKNLSCNKSRISVEGNMDARAIYATGETITVKNTDIHVDGKNNGFGIFVAEEGKATVQKNTVDVMAEKWSMGVYGGENSELQLKENKIFCHGNTNNIPIYITEEATVTVDSGSYEGKPISRNDTDSYGTAIFNLGTVQVENGEFIGGNSGIQCGEKSKTVINGGTFKSPNHGGVYVSCGSLGNCKINGGNFICNRGDYTEDELGNIVSFGAGYFGCSGQSEKWWIDIKNAYFENDYGNAVVQKSNDNYIPASLNLYGCTIKAKNYAVWIQNNESVDIYDTYINLYDGCKITGRIYDERATVTGFSRICYFY